MGWLLLLTLAGILQPPRTESISTTDFKIGPPTAIADLDPGRLGGELRRVAWSPDGRPSTFEPLRAPRCITSSSR